MVLDDLIAQAEVTEESFQELMEELDYDRTKRAWTVRESYKRKPRERKSESSKRDAPILRSRGSSAGSGIFQILAYGAVLVLVVVILYLIFSQIKLDKKLDPVLEMEEIEDIEDIDADNSYKVSLEGGDYRLALRMQFIKFLQLLSTQEKIIWEKEKTNRDYHRELAEHELKRNFRELSGIYERVWYGEEELDVTKFRNYDQKYISAHNKCR